MGLRLLLFRRNCSLRSNFFGLRLILNNRWVLSLWSVLVVSVIRWNFGILILSCCCSSSLCSLSLCLCCSLLSYCARLRCSLFWGLFNCLFWGLFGKILYIGAAFLCCFLCWGLRLWLTLLSRRFWSWQFRSLRSRLRRFSRSGLSMIRWSWLLRCSNRRISILSGRRWLCSSRLCGLVIAVSWWIFTVIVIFGLNGLLHFFEIFLRDSKRIM